MEMPENTQPATSVAKNSPTVVETLTEIKARAEKATPGPWEAHDDEWIDYPYDGGSAAVASVHCTSDDEPIPASQMAHNADFIAHARTDIPALVATVEAQAAELDKLKRERDTFTLAIESWKKEERVWRQSDHEHRIKQQQMQAGAELLIERSVTAERTLAEQAAEISDLKHIVSSYELGSCWMRKFCEHHWETAIHDSPECPFCMRDRKIALHEEWAADIRKQLGLEPGNGESVAAHLAFVLKQLANAERTLAELRERERWIPVTERMPNTGEPCWVVCNGNTQNVAYRRVGLGFACKDGYAWEAADSFLSEEADAIPDHEVSHWRPLPAPPDPTTAAGKVL